MIAIRGSRKTTEDIHQKVKAFLKDNLKLELNEDKTFITNVKKERVNFLGAEIRALTSRTHDAKQTLREYSGVRRKVRVPSGKMIILAPIEKLVLKLADQGICDVKNFAMRDIIPKRKSA